MSSIDIAYEELAVGGERPDHWSGPPELVERAAALTGTRGGHRLLDVGCGVGGPARLLAAMGCQVLAVDVLPRLVREAASRTPDRAVLFSAADAAELPVRDGIVDQVWCLGALAHFDDPLRFARESARVLRPGGAMVLTEAFWDGIRPPRSAATAPRPWRPVRVAAILPVLHRAGLAPDVRPWPAVDVPGALEPSDHMLRHDLADGRLRPALILARKTPA